MPTPKQEKTGDSGVYAIGITACLAKFLPTLLGQYDEIVPLQNSLAKLVTESVTQGYVLYLRTFLKTLHAKLHYKSHESLRKSQEDMANTSQKRKLETGSPTPSSEWSFGILAHTLSERRIEVDLISVEKSMCDCKLN